MPMAFGEEPDFDSMWVNEAVDNLESGLETNAPSIEEFCNLLKRDLFEK